MTLPNALRPSRMPPCSTRRPGSSRMMSAASRATSTAPATEMPTSAACSDGASLMPSPRKPTTWPRRLSARMMRFFCAGETRAKTRGLLGDVRQRRVAHALELARRARRRSTSRPTCGADVPGDQLVVAGEDLDRRRRRARSARDRRRAASGSGGSAKATKPASASSRSSATRVGAGRRRPRGRRPRARGSPAPLERREHGAGSAPRRGVVERRRPRRPTSQRRADGEDALGRALGDEQSRARASRRRPRGGAARSRTGSRRSCRSRRRPVAGAAEDRGVERAADARLEAAVEVGQRERRASDGRAERVERRARAPSRRAVSVPVLSLHRTSMLPKFWIAGRCLTITLLRAPCAPRPAPASPS